MDKAKEILTEWLTQVDSTHIKEGYITVILNAMEEYAELVNKTNDIHDVSESSELSKVKEERDQYKKLWQQSQQLKRELIKKYNLPIAEATLD